MNCDEVRELLPIYIGGGLDTNTRGLIAAHIAKCADCRSEAVMLTRLGIAVKSTAHKIPENARAAAFDLIKEEPKSDMFESLKDAFKLTNSALRLAYRLIKV